jgi:hypothetical protein
MAMSTEPEPATETEPEPTVDRPHAVGARMTPKERADLMALARMRAQVSKAQVAQRAAELEADFEEQLGTIYEFDRDEVWKEAMRLAAEAAAAASKAIKERCAELGILPEFAPGGTAEAAMPSPFGALPCEDHGDAGLATRRSAIVTNRSPHPAEWTATAAALSSSPPRRRAAERAAHACPVHARRGTR